MSAPKFHEPNSLKNVISSIPQLLKERLEEIEEREADWRRREESLRMEAKGTESSDVLELNVGGNYSMACIRRTLISIEGSMLAAKFSGQWDDTFERESNGRIFIDVDPKLFNQLLTVLKDYPEYSVTTSTLQTFELESSGHERWAASFDLTVDRFTKLAIGWHCGRSVTVSSSSMTVVGKYGYSTALDVTERLVRGAQCHPCERCVIA